MPGMAVGKPPSRFACLDRRCWAKGLEKRLRRMSKQLRRGHRGGIWQSILPGALGRRANTSSSQTNTRWMRGAFPLVRSIAAARADEDAGQTEVDIWKSILPVISGHTRPE